MKHLPKICRCIYLYIVESIIAMFYNSRWGTAYALSVWNKYTATDNYLVRLNVLGYLDAVKSFHNEIWYHRRVLMRDKATMLNIIFRPSSITENDYCKYVN